MKLHFQSSCESVVSLVPCACHAAWFFSISFTSYKKEQNTNKKPQKVHLFRWCWTSPCNQWPLIHMKRVQWTILSSFAMRTMNRGNCAGPVNNGSNWWTISDRGSFLRWGWWKRNGAFFVSSFCSMGYGPGPSCPSVKIIAKNSTCNIWRGISKGDGVLHSDGDHIHNGHLVGSTPHARI